ncbi:MAG: hypothetical protein WC450_12520 [Candidatus Omnitrophota bacterium]|jgi:hypothetical protein
MRFHIPFMSSSKQRHKHVIELKLRDIHQLFNSMDPAPFNDKDLDSDAEEFIVSWSNEFPPDDPVTLRIHLEQPPDDDPSDLIREAIHNYFAYRSKLNYLEFMRLMRQGRASLLIGLVFLAICLLMSKMLLPYGASTWAGFLREGLSIAGWVAMWRPMQIYLYDWWPLYGLGRTYNKLSKMPVDVILKSKTI